MLLKNGSRGNNVTKLQVALQTGGFLSYKATGYFGDMTTEAVKKYQKSKGLKEDGLVGSVTWSMLQSESFWPKESVPLRIDESVDGLTIYDYKLPQGEYVEEKYEKRTIWLHHTAGGCFTGETEIETLNGKVKIQDIDENDIVYVYSVDNNNNTVVSEGIGLGITKFVNTLLEIELDNGEKIKCTENHRFLLRNGDYIEAKDLKINDSLMPLYKRYDKRGYLEVKNNNSSKWEKSHQLSGKYKYGENLYKNEKQMVLHHIDFDKLNNLPENLLLMEKNEHIMYHASLMKDNWNDETWIKKMKKVSKNNMKKLKEKHKNDPEYKKFLSDLMKKRWEDGEFDYQKNSKLPDDVKEKISKSLKEKWLISEDRKLKQSKEWKDNWKSDEYREKMINIAKDNWKNPELVERMFKFDKEFNKKLWESEEHREKVSKAVAKRNKLYAIYKKSDVYGEITYAEWKDTYNHKVVNINKIILDEELPVYDIHVPGYENFALSSGVFVHNSRPDWTIDGWEKDRTSSGKRLRIGTHYVIGRRSSTNGDETWDGQILRAFDDEWFAYHLGVKVAGSKEINASSITIELCNYGGLTKTRDGKYLNWVNREIPEDEVCDLGYEFRGFRYWEKYTEEQIATLKKLILYISKKWNIPIDSGIYKEKWFEFDNKWLHGTGIRSHTQVRTDKYDLFPQPELIDMLNSL